MKSDFAVLDVTAGRAALRKRLDNGETIRVKVEANINGAWSRDDGISQEFALDVEKIEEVKT